MSILVKDSDVARLLKAVRLYQQTPPILPRKREKAVQELLRSATSLLRARLPWNGEAMTIALKESVKLQSHYAMLLNMHDGGERLQFPTADHWVNRLIVVGKIPAARPTSAPSGAASGADESLPSTTPSSGVEQGDKNQ